MAVRARLAEWARISRPNLHAATLVAARRDQARKGLAAREPELRDGVVKRYADRIRGAVSVDELSIHHMAECAQCDRQLRRPREASAELGPIWSNRWAPLGKHRYAWCVQRYVYCGVL